MAIVEPAQFTTQKMKKGYKPIVFVDIATPGLYWASRAIDISADTSSPGEWPSDYEDVFDSIGGINQSIGRNGGLATTGDISLTLKNEDNYCSILSSNTYLENKTAKVYLIFDDGSPLVRSESVQIYTGQVSNLLVDYNKFNINLSNSDLFLSEIIGELLTPGTYDGQDVDVSGQFIPIVFGNRKYGLASTDPGSVQLTYKNNMSPCIRSITDASTIQYVGSNHNLDSLTTNDIWIYDSESGRAYQVEPSTVTITNVDFTTGNSLIEIAKDAGYYKVYDFFFANAISENTLFDKSWTNINNIIDKDIDSYATITIGMSDIKESGNDGAVNAVVDPTQFTSSSASFVSNGVTTADYVLIKSGTNQGYYGISSVDNETTLTLATALSTDTGMDYEVGDPTWEANKPQLTFDYNIPSSATVLETSYYARTNVNEIINSTETLKISGDNVWDVTANTAATIATFTETDSDETDTQLTISLTNGNINGAYCTAFVYEVYKRVQLGFDFFDKDRFKIMIAPRGLEYGTWINNRDIAHGYTETHPDNNDAGQFIHNPVGAIEWLVRNELNLSSSDIDMNSFNIAANDRLTWKFDFTITEQKDTYEFVDSMAKACQCYLFKNNEDKLSISAYKQSGLSFVNSTGATPAASDIWNESPLSSGNSFTQHFINGKSISLTKTNHSNFANELEISYSYNYGSEQFQEVSISTNATSQTNYGESVKKIMDNKFIIDSASMGSFASNELAIRSTRDWLINVRSTLDSVHLELGDILNIRTTELYGILGTATTEAGKWQVINKQLQPLNLNGTVNFKAWRRE